MPLAQIIQGQLTKNSANNIARSICFNLDMILQMKMIKDWDLNKRLSQFDKSFSSFGRKEWSWLAVEVFSFGGLCFFSSDLLIRFCRFLAFMTFLCWFFFISIFYLNSLTILLFISYFCWSCWTYCWSCLQHGSKWSGKSTKSLDELLVEVGKS